MHSVAVEAYVTRLADHVSFACILACMAEIEFTAKSGEYKRLLRHEYTALSKAYPNNKYAKPISVSPCCVTLEYGLDAPNLSASCYDALV